MDDKNLIDFGRYQKLALDAASLNLPLSHELSSAIDDLIQRLREHQPLPGDKDL